MGWERKAGREDDVTRKVRSPMLDRMQFWRILISKR